ncbi:competence protein [Mesorhizobium sp. LSHC420B00]|uniref:competence protein CoiA n=1 Tax=unclassified Mesorhizobium TaxID=325217 RepID=UPI0003CEEB56|nr:competence protein CoiA family protein [Mesorhizobium sp. LSHC420B00]ESX80230.1 competence protein [Mesorhizobium sp. LSHC420B00]
MKFALVGGERREPEPTLTGQCPGCGETVTAKCGTQRVWHWAHKGLRTCDPWWEPETEWHRRWKNLFPVSWQETVRRSETTGERHIADVQTPHGLVIEFQHSTITPAERVSREHFYRDMIWVVDGTLAKKDRPRIDKGLPDWRWQPENKYTAKFLVENFLPSFWVKCDVPVLFDFDGLLVGPSTERQNHLICLLPNRYREDQAVFFPMARSTLVGIANNETSIPDWREICRDLDANRMQVPTASNRLQVLYRR